MAKSGGFRPVAHLMGNNTFQTMRFPKNIAADAGLNSLVYVGDAVSVTADGTVKAYQQISATRAVLGVVARVLTNEAGRARVHGLPDQHPNISLTAQPDYLDVYIDHHIIYECYINASASINMVGQGFSVTTTARVTAAGMSGQLLGVLAEVSAKAPFKVIGVSDFTLDTRQNSTGAVRAMVNYAVTKSFDQF